MSQGCLRSVSNMFKGFTREFQGCSMYFLKRSWGCFKGVSSRLKRASSLFKGGLRIVSTTLLGCLHDKSYYVSMIDSVSYYERPCILLWQYVIRFYVPLRQYNKSCISLWQYHRSCILLWEYNRSWILLWHHDRSCISLS